MFYGCSNIKELNLKNFNTNNVVDMSGMFSGCKNLVNLNVSNFSVNKNTDVKWMFSHCTDDLKISIKIQNKKIPFLAFHD